MSAIMQNTTTDTLKIEKNSKQAPAKNRTSHITEAFEALPQVEGFPLTTEQLWEYFNKAAKDKDIKIRKLTVKGEKKSAEDGLRGFQATISSPRNTLEKFQRVSES